MLDQYFQPTSPNAPHPSLSDPLTLMSLNIPSLSTPSLTSVIQLASRSHAHIIFLQETRLLDSNLSKINSLMYFARSKGWLIDFNNAQPDDLGAGTAILVDLALAPQIEFAHPYPGRLQSITIQNDQRPLAFLNVYAPAKASARRPFFASFNARLFSLPIWMGDFNAVLSSPSDRFNSNAPDPRQSHRPSMKDLSIIFPDRIDVWRHHHPGRSDYTWRRMKKSQLSTSRIDLVLADPQIVDLIDQVEIQPSIGSLSDHRPLLLRLHHSANLSSIPPPPPPLLTKPFKTIGTSSKTREQYADQVNACSLLLPNIIGCNSLSC